MCAQLIGALLLKPLAPYSSRSTAAIKKNNRKHFTIIPAVDIAGDKDKLHADDSVMEIKIVNNNCEMDKQKLHEVSLLPRKHNEDGVYNHTTIRLENIDAAQAGLCSKVCQRLVQSMDLELLKDPVFLSIIIGMALVYTSTIQFTMIFPSFLQVIYIFYCKWYKNIYLPQDCYVIFCGLLSFC